MNQLNLARLTRLADEIQAALDSSGATRSEVGTALTIVLAGHCLATGMTLEGAVEALRTIYSGMQKRVQS